MFYCEDCQKKNNWPKGLLGLPTSWGHCEICRVVGGCYDVPSKWLSNKKENDGR